MYYRRRFRPKPRYTYENSTAAQNRGRRRKTVALFTLLFFLVGLSAVALFLKELSTQIAISDASDAVTVSINSTINDIMLTGDFKADYFVNFEKSATGAISAISCNMARINALSAHILDRVVGATENRVMTVLIPIGNLTGINLLMGRGPKIPVEIVMLTSSRVEFNNNIITAGINQTKHQINLEVIVDIEILIPWDTEDTQVVTEVLIADTVIVGQVPDTYLNFGE